MNKMKYLYKYTCHKCGYVFHYLENEIIRCGKKYEIPLERKQHREEFPEHKSWHMEII